MGNLWEHQKLPLVGGKSHAPLLLCTLLMSVTVLKQIISFVFPLFLFLSSLDEVKDSLSADSSFSDSFPQHTRVKAYRAVFLFSMNQLSKSAYLVSHLAVPCRSFHLVLRTALKYCIGAVEIQSSRDFWRHHDWLRLCGAVLCMHDWPGSIQKDVSKSSQARDSNITAERAGLHQKGSEAWWFLVWILGCLLYLWCLVWVSPRISCT